MTMNELTSTRQAEIQAEVKQRWDSAQRHACSLVSDFIEIGRALHELKKGLAHGQFTPYVERTFPFLGKTQQWRAMKAFEAHQKREHEGQPLIGDESLEELVAIAKGKSSEPEIKPKTAMLRKRLEKILSDLRKLKPDLADPLAKLIAQFDSSE